MIKLDKETNSFMSQTIDDDRDDGDGDANADILDDVDDFEEDQPSGEKPAKLDLPKNETFEGEGNRFKLKCKCNIDVNLNVEK